MNKKTTRKGQYNESESVLYLAFELGGPNWQLAFSIGLGQKPRKRTIPSRDLGALQKEITAAKKRFNLCESARVVSCYEAGRDGFWLHRWLINAGIQNMVVDSSSIEVNRRKRRAKTDRLDAESLVRLLMRYDWFGEKKVWSVVRVPTVEQEDRRHTHRERSAWKKEKDRVTNRMRGLLATQGIRPGSPLNLSDDKLESMRLCDGSPIPTRLKDRLRREWKHLLFVKEQMAAVERDWKDQLRKGKEPDIDKIRALQKLRGIGTVGSPVVVREFFGWREFENAKQVGALAGLTGTPFQSGDHKGEQGISKAGNRRIRAVAVELAWSWIRFQPRSYLTQWFMTRFNSAGKRARKVGIVAVARRLLIDLWRFLETGALPEGAELKKSAA